MQRSFNARSLICLARDCTRFVSGCHGLAYCFFPRSMVCMGTRKTTDEREPKTVRKEAETMAARERYSSNNSHWTTLKAEVRTTIWQLLVQQGVARFPATHGRIPNFTGADKAAQLLRELTVWRKAHVVKV